MSQATGVLHRTHRYFNSIPVTIVVAELNSAALKAGAHVYQEVGGGSDQHVTHEHAQLTAVVHGFKSQILSVTFVEWQSQNHIRQNNRKALID